MPRSWIAAAMLGATFLTSFAIGSPMAMAQEAAGEACPATTPEENKALVTQFYDALSGSGADVGALFAADHVHHEMSGEETAEEGSASDWAANRREDFPDHTVSIELLMAEGDMVAVYASMSGTHQDDDEDMGIPATGMQAEWVAASFFRIECGKIAESWAVSDWLGRLQDLGVITEEELQSVAAATPAP